MVEGIVKIIQNGEVVAEGHNLITTLGKRAILRYLAGQVDNYAGGLAVGISSSTPTTGDQVLGFEVARVEVQNTSVSDYANFDIVFKASLPSDLKANIREVGLISNFTNTSTRGASNAVLALLDSAGEGWTVTNGPAITSETTESRFGFDGIKINSIPLSTTSVIELSTALDMSEYVASDLFKFFYATYDTNCQSIRVEFINNDGKSLYYDIVPATHTAGAGNPQSAIATVGLSSFVNWAADWTDIETIKITTTAKNTGTCSVMYDGLIVADNNGTDENSCLVTHALIGPVNKLADVDMDIEYTLRFGL